MWRGRPRPRNAKAAVTQVRNTKLSNSRFQITRQVFKVETPRLLVHTWNGSYDSLKTVVRWELEPHSVHGLHASGPKKSGTGTLVRVRQEGFAGNVESATDHGEGWKRVL